jgi:beta-glucosidase
MFSKTKVNMFPPVSSLTIAQLIAQMIVVRTTGFLFDQQLQYPAWEANGAKLRHLVETVGVGGVIFLGASAAEMALKTAQLQAWAEIPLLLCADVEEGVGQRFSGATVFPPPMALSAIAAKNLDLGVNLARTMGSVIAQESRAIGLNWILAPIVDVNNNPNNPVINVRAFGEDPRTVIALTEAFIQGAESHSVLTCAKHFPGHGDTDLDSHLELPLISHDLARLETVEFPPFQAAIASGVSSVMTAHLDVPALDPENITTFSPAVNHDWLRDRWGFEGLVVTDALVMGAIVDRFGEAEVAVLAVEAGADILMMPVDALNAIEALTEAVESGRLTRDRLETSVERIWAAKQRVTRELPPVTQIQLTETIALPQFEQCSAEILRASMTVHHPERSRLTEAKWQGDRQSLILVDDLLNSPFLTRTAPAIVQVKAQGYGVKVVESSTDVFLSSSWRSTLLQIFVRGNPLRGTGKYVDRISQWLEFLIRTDQLQGVILYGSPYVAAKILPILPEDVPSIFTYGQGVQAQTVALEAFFQKVQTSAQTGKDGMFA